MEKEDFKLLPLVAIGLGKAAMNVFIKPFAQDKIEQARGVAKASIQYWSNDNIK